MEIETQWKNANSKAWEINCFPCCCCCFYNYAEIKHIKCWEEGKHLLFRKKKKKTALYFVMLLVFAKMLVFKVLCSLAPTLTFHPTHMLTFSHRLGLFTSFSRNGLEWLAVWAPGHHMECSHHPSLTFSLGKAFCFSYLWLLNFPRNRLKTEGVVRDVGLLLWC